MKDQTGPRREPGPESPDAARGAGGLTRRAMIGGSVAAVALLVGSPLGGASAIAVPVGHDAAGFLTDEELQRLGALVDTFVPGPPVDKDGGALAAGCAEAIDALLGAFNISPPRIYAGAPFSNRDGSAVDYFEQFLTLDDYETTAWRLWVEGSKGNPALEFNGPIKGWQQIYRDGLAALGSGFADLPEPAREVLLRSSSDAAVKDLVDVAWPHTYQFIYGAPEYGGNRNLIGWTFTNWDGDRQPNGYTRREVAEPDDGQAPLTGGDLELVNTLLALLPLGASSEAAAQIALRSGGRLSAMRRELAPLRSVTAAIDNLTKGQP